MMEHYFDNIQDTGELSCLIEKANDLASNCDCQSDSVIHELDCFVDEVSLEKKSQESDCDKKYITKIPRCQRALLRLIVHVIAKRPSLIEDNVKQKLIEYFNRNKTKANGLISHDVLKILHHGSSEGSNLLVWLKYESVIIALVRENIYQPETLANEVLALSKEELNSDIASKFASVLESCVRYCREVNKKHANESELEEKWCEIIDWMSWFLTSGDDCCDF